MLEPSILLPRRILEQLGPERERRLPLETGGFLLGLRRGHHIEITDVTVQGPHDIAGPVSFERVDASHTRTALAAWENRGQSTAIVGDWHSHPSGSPTPSGLDRKAWRTLASSLRAPAVGLILAHGNELGMFITERRWPFAKVRRCNILEDTTEDLVFTRGEEV